MRDLTGDVNNPIWELLKKYPGYRFTISHCIPNNTLVLTVTNETRTIKSQTVLALWCISDPVSMIEQMVYHFEECARKVYKKENK